MLFFKIKFYFETLFIGCKYFIVFIGPFFVFIVKIEIIALLEDKIFVLQSLTSFDQKRFNSSLKLSGSWGYFDIKGYLRVQRKRVESHWTDKRDVRGLGVEHVVVCGDPQSGMLRENFNNLKESMNIMIGNIQNSSGKKKVFSAVDMNMPELGNIVCYRHCKERSRFPLIFFLFDDRLWFEKSLDIFAVDRMTPIGSHFFP